MASFLFSVTISWGHSTYEKQTLPLFIAVMIQSLAFGDYAHRYSSPGLNHARAHVNVKLINCQFLVHTKRSSVTTRPGSRSSRFFDHKGLTISPLDL
jgi:hypothetical protein